MSLSPYLTFDGNCREAFEFYRSVLGGEFSQMMTFADGPEDLPVAKDERDRILHVALPFGSGVLMGSDSCAGMGGGPLVRGNNLGIALAAESREHCEALFEGLSAGGTVEMPLEEAFWGALFGKWTDRFGVDWMVNYDLPRP